MTKPRKAQMSLDSTPYYYCSSSCNKRTFLSGVDPETQKNYESRRKWIEERLEFLSSVFSIQHCALDVLAHHYHIILHIDQDAAKAWTTMEVISRWHKIFNGSSQSRRLLKGAPLSEEQQSELDKQVQTWRNRLMDMSWYMRCANESIAREVNREEKCTGRFWEGRFKSKALNDETALQACMRYVTPISRKVAAISMNNTPNSDNSSGNNVSANNGSENGSTNLSHKSGRGSYSRSDVSRTASGLNV